MAGRTLHVGLPSVFRGTAALHRRRLGFRMANRSTDPENVAPARAPATLLGRTTGQFGPGWLISTPLEVGPPNPWGLGTVDRDARNGRFLTGLECLLSPPDVASGYAGKPELICVGRFG